MSYGIKTTAKTISTKQLILITITSAVDSRVVYIASNVFGFLPALNKNIGFFISPQKGFQNDFLFDDL